MIKREIINEIIRNHFKIKDLLIFSDRSIIKFKLRWYALLQKWFFEIKFIIRKLKISSKKGFIIKKQNLNNYFKY